LAKGKSAQKRARQSAQRRKHNASRRSTMRTCIKKVTLAVQAKNLSASLESFRKVQAILDRFAVKGLICDNKAARHKSNLMKQIKHLEAALSTSA
jgi:small subunit ribosomal protein S20